MFLLSINGIKSLVQFCLTFLRNVYSSWLKIKFPDFEKYFSLTISLYSIIQTPVRFFSFGVLIKDVQLYVITLVMYSKSTTYSGSTISWSNTYHAHCRELHSQSVSTIGLFSVDPGLLGQFSCFWDRNTESAPRYADLTILIKKKSSGLDSEIVFGAN